MSAAIRLCNSAGGEARFVAFLCLAVAGTGFALSASRATPVRAPAGSSDALRQILSDGTQSMISTYPLASLLARELQFNQVAEGTSGGVEYWTGVALERS